MNIKPYKISFIHKKKKDREIGESDAHKWNNSTQCQSICFTSVACEEERQYMKILHGL
jgi:hypothetical protein